MFLLFKVSDQWRAPFKLFTIDIRNCYVGPSFPAWLQYQTELKSATLSNTNISETIPEELFLMLCVRIEYLDLSYNQIHGRLPLQLTCPSLYHIDLSRNRFSSPFPILSAKNVTFLNFESNLFSGSIPSQLDQLMPELTELYLSENQFHGTIPASISNIKNMGILTLRTNQFYGEFPEAWSLWSWILVLDVGYNNLSGHVPTSMGVPSSLAVLKLNNNFSGRFPSMISEKCTSMKSIDLGSSQFTGILPSMMPEELAILRLRSNFFSGHIPQHLCCKYMLHALDLGDNNFSGTIPKCLEEMFFLVEGISNGRKCSTTTWLELGRVPSSTQLTTLDDATIYEGNPSLCGAPLARNCSEPHAPGVGTKEKGDQDEDDNEKLGLYSSGALGFIIGFWGVCGTLLVKKSWRYAYL